MSQTMKPRVTCSGKSWVSTSEAFRVHVAIRYAANPTNHTDASTTIARGEWEDVGFKGKLRWSDVGDDTNSPIYSQFTRQRNGLPSTITARNVPVQRTGARRPQALLANLDTQDTPPAQITEQSYAFERQPFSTRQDTPRIPGYTNPAIQTH